MCFLQLVTAVRFLANMYKANDKNHILKPGIELTNPIGYPIRVYLEEMNNTAKSEWWYACTCMY